MLKSPDLLALEDPRPHPMAYEVPDFPAEERGERDREAHPPDVDLDDAREGAAHRR